MSIFQMSLYFVLSLSIVLVTMPFLIQYLKKLSFKQTVSEYALEDDKKKAGTPIMGGILFIIVPVVLTLIFVKECIPRPRYTNCVTCVYGLWSNWFCG